MCMCILVYMCVSGDFTLLICKMNEGTDACYNQLCLQTDIVLINSEFVIPYTNETKN